MVDPLALGLLGRHVGERAHDVAGARERLVPGEVGDAEVGPLGHAGRRARRIGDQHVLGLDVAMHDAALVRVLERAAQREPDRQHVAVAQQAIGVEVVDRAAVDQLRHQVAGLHVLARVEDGDDPGMVESAAASASRWARADRRCRRTGITFTATLAEAARRSPRRPSRTRPRRGVGRAGSDRGRGPPRAQPGARR